MSQFKTALLTVILVVSLACMANAKPASLGQSGGNGTSQAMLVVLAGPIAFGPIIGMQSASMGAASVNPLYEAAGATNNPVYQDNGSSGGDVPDGVFEGGDGGDQGGDTGGGDSSGGGTA